MSSKKQARLAVVNTKIAELTAERDTLVKELENAVNEADLQVGRNVDFVFGRGETRGGKTGVIVGRKEAEGKVGVQLRIATGEGFDATVLTIYAADVTRLQAVEAPAAAEQQ